MAFLSRFLNPRNIFYLSSLFILSVTGGMAVAYLGTGRFDPKKQPWFSIRRRNCIPRSRHRERRDYADQLDSLLAKFNVSDGRSKPVGTTGVDGIPWKEILGSDNAKNWAQLLAKGEPGLDSMGRPILEVQIGGRLVNVGLSRENILSSPGPSRLAQEVLTSRLRSELKRNAR